MDRNVIDAAESARQVVGSLPSRGAWIEIIMHHVPPACARVAPLAGSVDRNSSREKDGCPGLVAPLAGSVDRNHQAATLAATVKPSLPSRGAWIEIPIPQRRRRRSTSLPSRGAWIEITKPTTSCRASAVAPLAGSVDRNYTAYSEKPPTVVAPLAGSVDRNLS